MEQAAGTDAGFCPGLHLDRDLRHALHSPVAREIEKVERLPALAA
jgi:hypothetical protein